MEDTPQDDSKMIEMPDSIKPVTPADVEPAKVEMVGSVPGMPEASATSEQTAVGEAAVEGSGVAAPAVISEAPAELGLPAPNVVAPAGPTSTPLAEATPQMLNHAINSPVANQPTVPGGPDKALEVPPVTGDIPPMPPAAA